MSWKVLIAHATGEQDAAERLAIPIREAGYEVSHQGTILVGESVVDEASKVLSLGGPVVLCGTVRAVGTGWARKQIAAARPYSGVRVFIVHMDEEADVDALAFGDKVGRFWQDPGRATKELLAALKHYYALDADTAAAQRVSDAEQLYRTRLLQFCDIVNLANLPEQDRHLAQRQLELRRLYVPVRAVRETGSAPGERPADSSGQTGELPLSERPLARSERVFPATERVSVGERLQESRKIVVLGDPGSGKTTLTRWIATTYLLRLGRDPDWRAIPDVATLPDEDWLPIIVRCRDLDGAALAGGLEPLLLSAVRRTEIGGESSRALIEILRARLENGTALLMIDGLDEIAEAAARARFCDQLGDIHLAYRSTPIVVTSRDAAYRDLGRRIGHGFEHLKLAPFSREEKDDFARRWCELTEPPDRRTTAAEELIADIHSTDRIERLTGNPMLLTTMALVKRKVGKLPRRRADLYREAIEVLLNWRREVDAPMDWQEAIPQLEYVAYAMCDLGIKQIRRDKAEALIEQMRTEYPNVHATHVQKPNAFLRQLEARTGMLVEAGHEPHLGLSVPVYEFRHLTFQEYLAARALVDGCFPGRNPLRRLAEHVAPLAGRVVGVAHGEGPDDTVVEESWREALRLCATICHNDDVDRVLKAIATPLAGEPPTTLRARAVLAASCLADEPNASETTATEVFARLASCVRPEDSEHLFVSTGLPSAVRELAASRWKELLFKSLLREFLASPRTATARLLGDVTAFVHGLGYGFQQTGWTAADVTAAYEKMNDESGRQLRRLSGGDRSDRVEAALIVMHAAFDYAFRSTKGNAEKTDNASHSAVPNESPHVDALADPLIDLLEMGVAEAIAAAWALSWLARGSPPLFVPEGRQLARIVQYANRTSASPEAVRFLSWDLLPAASSEAVPALIRLLDADDSQVGAAGASALGRIKDPRAIEPLLASLDKAPLLIRRDYLAALEQIGGEFDYERVLPFLGHGATRDVAARAIKHLSDPRLTTRLAEGLRDPNKEVRLGALDAMIAGGHVGALSEIETVARTDPDNEVRIKAIEALRVDEAAAVSPLGDLIADSDPAVRAAAAAALATLDLPDAQALLRKHLNDDDSEVRMAAVTAAALKLPDMDRRLMSRDFDGTYPFIDPREPIRETDVQRAAAAMQLAPQEVRSRYEALRSEFGLQLA
jgi:HEAT repeat protein